MLSYFRTLFARLRGHRDEDFVATRRWDGNALPTTAYSEVSEQIDEGLMIISAGVRIAIKNAIVIRALRDRADFDRNSYLRVASRHFHEAGSEKHSESERISAAITEAEWRYGNATGSADYRSQDVDNLTMREEVTLGLSTKLHQVSEDPVFIGDQVDQAHRSASEEIRRALSLQLINGMTVDESYAQEREERLRGLLDDLAPWTTK